MLADTSLIAKELESPCSLKISFNSSTSVRGTGITYGEQINSTIISHILHAIVRMAERSKAPDSRLITFPADNGSGRSGLRMEAWVRIPLLTVCFFSFCLIFFSRFVCCILSLHFFASVVLVCHQIKRPFRECYGSQNGLRTCAILSFETQGRKETDSGLQEFWQSKTF